MSFILKNSCNRNKLNRKTAYYLYVIYRCIKKKIKRLCVRVRVCEYMTIVFIAIDLSGLRHSPNMNEQG